MGDNAAPASAGLAAHGVPAAEAAGAAAAGTSTARADEEEVYIFGYGSLIHKNHDFEYDLRIEGYIKGWRRVWWQGSTDHRGTPEAPGRTVTLEERPGTVTWGVAFRLAGTPQKRDAALRALEWREKQYDVRLRVDVWAPARGAGVGGGGGGPGGRPAPAAAGGGGGGLAGEQRVVRGALVYVGSADRSRNANYLGPAPNEVIAATIAWAVGPSGPNHEYLFRLAEAMRRMGVKDEELFGLERHVRALLPAAAAASAGDGAPPAEAQP